MRLLSLRPETETEGDVCRRKGWWQASLSGLSWATSTLMISMDCKVGLSQPLSLILVPFTISAFLLNVHVQIEEVDDEGWSPLIHACVLGKVQGALTLIDNGAQLDLKVNQIGFLNQLISLTANILFILDYYMSVSVTVKIFTEFA